MLKVHGVLSARQMRTFPPSTPIRTVRLPPPRENLQAFEKLHKTPGNTNGDAGHGSTDRFAAVWGDDQGVKGPGKTHHINGTWCGREATEAAKTPRRGCRICRCRLRVCLLRCRKLSIIGRHTVPHPLKPNRPPARLKSWRAPLTMSRNDR